MTKVASMGRSLDGEGRNMRLEIQGYRILRIRARWARKAGAGTMIVNLLKYKSIL
jgi:hypothetical protein